MLDSHALGAQIGVCYDCFEAVDEPSKLCNLLV
jgi:hypothetical protein